MYSHPRRPGARSPPVIRPNVAPERRRRRPTGPAPCCARRPRRTCSSRSTALPVVPPPAPNPCTPRNAISRPASRLASPQPSDAVWNMARPSISIRRAAQQVRRPPAEKQEAAEGDPVGGDDPLQVRFGEVQGAADRRQRDVHDRQIDDRHEKRDGEHRERSPPVDLWYRFRSSHCFPLKEPTPPPFGRPIEVDQRDRPESPRHYPGACPGTNQMPRPAGPVVRMLTPGDVSELAGRLGVRPSKRFGKNFVIEPGTVRRIAALARLRPDDVVLEVGAALGSLTLALLEAGAGRLLALEIDPVLAAALPQTIAARAPGLAGRVSVVAADALRIGARDLPAAPAGGAGGEPAVQRRGAGGAAPAGRLAVAAARAGHGPGRGGGPDVRRPRVPGVRHADRPNWPGSLTPTRPGPVPRSVFWPVPNVDSRLVAFTRRDPPQTTATRAEVFAVVDAAFPAAAQNTAGRAVRLGWLGTRGRTAAPGGRARSGRARGNARRSPSSRAWPRRVRLTHRDRCDRAGARQTQPPARGGSAAR